MRRGRTEKNGRERNGRDDQTKKPGLVDPYADRRDGLVIEFAKIALEAVLAYPESVSWPADPIATRVFEISKSLAIKIYPLPVKPTPTEAQFLGTSVE